MASGRPEKPAKLGFADLLSLTSGMWPKHSESAKHGSSCVDSGNVGPENTEGMGPVQGTVLNPANREENGFDLEKVLRGFQACYVKKHKVKEIAWDDDDIILEKYLDSFDELCRFFKLAGRLFSFVARDMESKIQVLRYAALNEMGDNNHYISLRAMVEFETHEGNYIARNGGKYPSGCRTLLRLHQISLFILTFMEQLLEAPPSASTKDIASEIYAHTLAKQHSWVVRKLADFVMMFLPSRSELIGKMCKQQNQDEVNDLIAMTLQAGSPVYECIDFVLTSHGLTDM